MGEQVTIVIDPLSLPGLLMQLVLGWWCVVGLVAIVRVAPVIRGWVNRGIKPWACDLCMSFWTSVLSFGAVAYVQGWPQILPMIPMTTALSLATLSRLTAAPPGGPADLPPLRDLEQP